MRPVDEGLIRARGWARGWWIGGVAWCSTSCAPPSDAAIQVERPGTTGVSTSSGDDSPYVPIESAGASSGSGSDSGPAGSDDGDDTGSTSSGDDSGTEAGDGSTDGTSEGSTGSTGGGSMGEGGDASSSGTSEGSTGSTSTDGSSSDTGGDEGGFGPIGTFGDQVQETDLVGTWGSPWDPTGTADVTLTISDTGAFVWRETADGCATERIATGDLWVETTQLVLHVEAWDKRVPWDVETEVGLSVTPPFRLRLGYSTMGTYLSIAGPADLLDVRDWSGVSYDRIAAGLGPQGDWVSEAELWARVDDDAQLVVRERYEAALEAGGAATLTRTRTWWVPGPGPTSEDPSADVGVWTDETPGQPAGAGTVLGETFAYDALHMFPFVPGRSLQLGAVGACP